MAASLGIFGNWHRLLVDSRELCIITECVLLTVKCCKLFKLRKPRSSSRLAYRSGVETSMFCYCTLTSRPGDMAGCCIYISGSGYKHFTYKYGLSPCVLLK
ncbi:3,2-trans-enoyl-CoA isomerase [Fusarium oxysporum f. sp. albedinis]|nr:3,2-trans-enoyl-CoA isomerase [Fusarium oxysporum f. sp. albedinis]